MRSLIVLLPLLLLVTVPVAPLLLPLGLDLGLVPVLLSSFSSSPSLVVAGAGLGVLTAGLADCLSRVVGQVIRRRILARAMGMGWWAIRAFIASRAWDLEDLVVTTPVQVGGGVSLWTTLGLGSSLLVSCSVVLVGVEVPDVGFVLSVLPFASSSLWLWLWLWFPPVVPVAEDGIPAEPYCPLLNRSSAFSIMPGVYTRLLFGSTTFPATISTTSR